MFNKLIKLIVILGTVYQTPGYSKSASFNDFNSKDLTELMDWIEKATIRMNNIANLLEKK